MTIYNRHLHTSNEQSLNNTKPTTIQHANNQQLVPQELLCTFKITARKNGFNIPKGEFKSINQGRIDNTVAKMDKQRSTKLHTED